MDESSLTQFVLSSNDALCRKNSRQFEDLQTLLIDMKKEIGDLKLIQDLLGTQVDTLMLHGDKSVLSTVGSGRSKESAKIGCDA